MRTQRIILIFGLVLIAVAVFLLMTSAETSSASGDTVPTAAGDYRGADNCQPCHSDVFDEWNVTNHARVFDPGAPYFTSFISRGAPDSCQPCHVVGHNEASIGGYDPALPWNDSYNLPLLGIQCENCHGADPMSLPVDQRFDTASGVCFQCHSGSRRPQFDEWNGSAHASGTPPFVERLECAGCHEAQASGAYVSTGDAPTALPADPRWQLTCVTCHDPHNASNERQLRRPVNELCSVCHTSEGAGPGDAVHHAQAEMRTGTAAVPVSYSGSMSAVYCAECHMYAYAYDSSMTPPAMAGHGFEPRPEACVSCHDGTSGFLLTKEGAETAIEGWQEATHLQLETVRASLQDASDAIDGAADLGFDPATVGKAAAYYDQANYSANFVEADGSMGVHNFDYAANLLAYGDLKAGQVVAMLTPGKLTGTVVDSAGDPVSGIQILRAGKVWATSGQDGRFSFRHAPGSFTFTLLQEGKEVGTLDAVILADQTSDVRAMAGATGPAAPPAATEGLQFVTILLLVITIILMVVLIARRRVPPEMKKEPPVETEVYEEAK